MLSTLPPTPDPEATPRVVRHGHTHDDVNADAANANSVDITWDIPSLAGDAPCPRGGHTAVLVDTQLLVFGGHYFGGHGEFVYLNDLHRLDLETSCWHAIPFHDRDAVLPAPRYNHSAVLMNDSTRMFVFGGRGEHGNVWRDLFFLDLQRNAWFQVQWTTASPPARFGHGSVSTDDHTLLIFGGWDGHKSMNDLWSFDTAAFTWTKLPAKGKPPSARHNASVVPVSADLVLVYGGYSVQPETLPVYNHDMYLLDVTTTTWTRPRVTGEHPMGTFGQSLCLHNDLAVVLGGWSGTERTPIYMGDKQVRATVKALAREERLRNGHEERHDRHTRELQTASSYARVLDLTRLEWRTVRSEGIAVGNRYGHTCTIVGPHLFLFGGWDGNRALNQVVVGAFTVAEQQHSNA